MVQTRRTKTRSGLPTVARKWARNPPAFASGQANRLNSYTRGQGIYGSPACLIGKDACAITLYPGKGGI